MVVPLSASLSVRVARDERRVSDPGADESLNPPQISGNTNKN
jgi:hypothetical protein